MTKCLAWMAVLPLVGCNTTGVWIPEDFGIPGDVDMSVSADDGGTNPCGNNNPSCTAACVGPTCSGSGQFPLPSDNPPPTNVTADGVGRDPMGYIVLDSTRAAFDYMWIADDFNYNRGLVSKISTKERANPPVGAINGKYREVARYVTFTCKSDPVNGSNEGLALTNLPNAGSAPAAPTLCANGVNGCCARAMTSDARSLAINTGYNRPSRTAVDFSGDVWIANRAHDTSADGWDQGSVTKIASKNNSITDTNCIDRNNNGVIDTSSDANDDGIIETDCNNDGVADTGVTACTGGRMQEFWGLDDECVLFTVNVGAPQAIIRPLTLGPGASDFAPSDAWVGAYNTGKFYRINGSDGHVVTPEVTLIDQGPDPRPYGGVIDQFGILWAPNLIDQTLYYFDTNAADPNAASAQGFVQPPPGLQVGGTGFYGVGIDGYTETPAGSMTPQLVQQVWVGHWQGNGAYRYRPVRNQGFNMLGTGTWSQIGFGSTGRGRGIGCDNRMPQSYCWVGIDGNPGKVGRIPINIADGLQTLTAIELTTNQTGMNDTIGTGVAANLDVWSVNRAGNSATHFAVDAMGAVTSPLAADQVKLDDSVELAHSMTHRGPEPYTYSDFTGFGLRNFTNPRGNYNWIETGCGAGRTHWIRVDWDAEVPPGTALTVRTRSANDANDLPMATWTGNYASSPANLEIAPGPVTPNPSGFLEVEFDLSSLDHFSTPKLKSFTVVWECVDFIP